MLKRFFNAPAITSTAVLTLALGVAATVVMVDTLDRLLVRGPAQVRAPQHVTRFYLPIGPNIHMSGTSYPVFERLSPALANDLEYSAAYLEDTLTLGRGPQAQRVHVVAHSDAYFDVLGVLAARGRLPNALVPAPADAAVVSYALAQRRLDGPDTAVGRPIQLGARVYTVVAVAARGFAGIDNQPVDVWLPLEGHAQHMMGPGWRTMPSMSFRLIGRARKAVERAPAEERATAAYRAGSENQPWMQGGRVILGELLLSRAPGAAKDASVPLWIAAVSGLVLIIACANVGTLLLVRGLRQSRVFAIKTALGASRGRLIREVLADAALLSLISGIAALGFVLTGGAVVRRLFLPLVAATAVPLDARLIAQTIVVCVCATLLLGTVPALRLTAGHSLNPVVSSGAPQFRLLDAFIALQVALSVPLVVGAGLFVQSFSNARHHNSGIDSERLLAVSTNLFEVGRPADNHYVHRQIQERLASLPFVESIALVQQLPLHGYSGFNVSVPEADPGESPAMAFVNAVDPTFFNMTGVRIIAGRELTRADNRANAPPVAVVNETMAEMFWPSLPAIGRCFYMGPTNGPCTAVVGVSADTDLFPDLTPARRSFPTYYVPIEQHPALTSSRALLVRTRGAVPGGVSSLRREAHLAVPDLPFVETSRFDDVFEPALRPWRLASTMLVAFGVLSLIIAAVGLATVTAYAVMQRRREFGIRLALGADTNTLITSVVRRALTAVIGGVAAGGVLAYAFSQSVTALLFGISPHDVRVFATTGIILVAVGLVAAWLPARRVASIDPAVVLKVE